MEHVPVPSKEPAPRHLSCYGLCTAVPQAGAAVIDRPSEESCRHLGSAAQQAAGEGGQAGAGARLLAAAPSRGWPGRRLGAAHAAGQVAAARQLRRKRTSCRQGQGWGGAALRSWSIRRPASVSRVITRTFRKRRLASTRLRLHRRMARRPPVQRRLQPNCQDLGPPPRSTPPVTQGCCSAWSGVMRCSGSHTRQRCRGGDEERWGGGGWGSAIE